MATYNGEKYIKKQIESILSQLSDEDELIVSDDGSTDGTIDVINSFHDERVVLLFHQKKNCFGKKKAGDGFYNVTQNFENALKRANGDYIFLSDQDDVWADNKVSRMMEVLRESDCVMCNFSVMNASNSIITEKYYEKSPIKNSLLQNVLASKFIGCCMAFRRKVLDVALPFPQDLIAHDYWIGCIARKKYKFVFLDEPLHFYRRTGDNVSPSTEGSTNPFWFKIYYRICFLVLLMKRLNKKK